MKNKIVLLGAPGVGKTSFFLAATKQFDSFQNNGVIAYQPTIGATYALLQTYLDENNNVTDMRRSDLSHDGLKGPQFGIWDTAGQERYNSLLPMYTRNALVVVIMHEGTKRTLERATKEAEIVKRNEPGAKLYIIQTKSDVKIPFNDSIVKEIEADGWAYISTLGTNLLSVDDAMIDILQLANKTIMDDIIPTEESQIILRNTFYRRYCCIL
jgi:small GTP-binding protein